MAEATTRRYFEAPVEQIDTGTATLPCRRFGQGPPVLLVHGFPLSGFTWRKVLPELAQRHTCWVPDLPGMGDSQWTEANDFSFPGQGRTLKTLVDRLGLERYGVVAQDTGGTFAAISRSPTLAGSRSWSSSTPRSRTTGPRGSRSISG